MTTAISFPGQFSLTGAPDSEFDDWLAPMGDFPEHIHFAERRRPQPIKTIDPWAKVDKTTAVRKMPGFAAALA